MAEIKSLSEIRDKWTRVTPGRTENYKLGISNSQSRGESSIHKKSHLCKPVNPYQTICRLKRINFLLKQGISLLTQEIQEMKNR